jgi:hypothetical protein
MFSKPNVSKSVLDAISNILVEGDKKLLLEPGKKADDKAAAKGTSADVREGAAESPFTSWKKPREVEPKGGSGVKQGTRYGGSAQKSKPEQDDGKVKKEEIESMEEAKFDPLKHVKNPSPAVKAAAKDVKRGSYADRAALMKAGGVKDDRGPRGVTQEEVEQVEERTLTPKETSEKERIVKGMKKGLSGFKARYGDRAKSVMYATATKSAKNEEVESVDEGLMDKAKALGKKVLDKVGHGDDEDMIKDLQKKVGVPQTGKKPMKAEELKGNQHKIDKNKNGKIDAHDFKLLRKEEIKEEVKTTHKDPLVAVHDTDGSLWTHANLSVANDIHGCNVGHKDVHSGPVKSGRWTFKISKHHASSVNEEKEESLMDTKTTDTLAGRKKVPATFHNQHSDYKVKLAKEEKDEGHEDEKEDKALIAKMVKKSSLVKSLDKNGDGKHTMADHKKEKVSEGKGTDVDSTFATDANTTNSPLNLAKGLAHKSFKKIKNEVMGKTGTSEEKKKW